MKARLRTLMVYLIAICYMASFSTALACGTDDRAPPELSDEDAIELAEIELLWNSYVTTVQADDKEAALEFFNPAKREKYKEIFDSMGPFFKEQYFNVLEFVPITLSDEVAVYSLCVSSEKYGFEIFPVSFVRHPELGWRLSQL